MGTYSNPNISEETFAIKEGCIHRDNKDIPIRGFGKSVLGGLLLGKVDLHGDNLVVQDRGDTIQINEFDYKFSLSTNQEQEMFTGRNFFKVIAKEENMEALDRLKEKIGSKRPSVQQGKDLKKLELSVKPLMPVLDKEGMLDEFLHKIFPDENNVYDSYGSRDCVFKFTFPEDFHKAPHVREEFMDGVYVMEQLSPDKIKQLVSSTVGKEFLCKNGETVVSMITQQLLANQQDIIKGMEHCPEYKQYKATHKEHLENISKESNQYVEESIKEMSKEASRTRKSFTAELENARNRNKESGVQIN